MKTKKLSLLRILWNILSTFIIAFIGIFCVAYVGEKLLFSPFYAFAKAEMKTPGTWDGFVMQGFDKVDDSQLPCPWWREFGLDRDIDTFWSFDFEEYRLSDDPGFTLADIRRKMHDPAPAAGSVLLGEGNRSILLMHAHDSTEAVLPRYYQVLLGELLASGVTFEEPRFIRLT